MYSCFLPLEPLAAERRGFILQKDLQELAQDSNTILDELETEGFTKEKDQVVVSQFSLANKKLKLNSSLDVSEFVDFIKEHKDLKILAFNGNTLGVEACKALAEAMETLEMIEEVDLSDCFTGRMKEEVPPSIEAFSNILKAKKTLKRVDFSDNALGPAGAKAVAVLLKESVSLEKLQLNNNGLGPEGGKIIAQALLDCSQLAKDLNQASSLRSISIGRNRLENGSALLLGKAIEAHDGLEEIALYQNGIRPEGIVSLASGISKCHKLYMLNLQDNTFTYKGSEAIADSIAHLQQLEILNLGDCLLSNDGCVKIIDSLVQSGCAITSLNLQYNELNEEGAMHLVHMLPHLSSLKVLMLNGNSFDPTGDAALAIKETLQLNDRLDILDNWSDMDFGDSEGGEDDECDSDKDEDKDVVSFCSDTSADDLAKTLTKLEISKSE